MFLEKIPLLESKIINLETVNSNWVKVDSLRSNQVTMYKDALVSKERDIAQLKKSIKTSNYITGGSILASIILALLCALK